MTVGTLPVALGDMFARGHEFSDGGVCMISDVLTRAPSRVPHPACVRGVPLAASSLLHYGITPTDSSKTDVIMRFLVENYL